MVLLLNCLPSLLPLSTSMLQNKCFAGNPEVRPAEPFCCDTFAAANECPAGTINPDYKNLIGQPVNETLCSGFGPAPAPKPSTLPPAMPPAMMPPMMPSTPSTPSTPSDTPSPPPPKGSLASAAASLALSGVVAAGALALAL